MLRPLTYAPFFSPDHVRGAFHRDLPGLCLPYLFFHGYDYGYDYVPLLHGVFGPSTSRGRWTVDSKRVANTDLDGACAARRNAKTTKPSSMPGIPAKKRAAVPL